MSERLFVFSPHLDGADDYNPCDTEPATEDQANLVSSETADGTHLPVLDVDFSCRLIPSTTPGHFHLYLDGLRLDWAVYQELLLALAKAGVIEQGYADVSIKRGATMVRKPGVMKPIRVSS